MAFTQDFVTSRNNFPDGTTRTGQLDRLWYDSNTNTIRIGDNTPGGKIVGGGGSVVSSPTNTGFENRTDSVMQFDANTRTFSISPATSSYTIYLGSAITKTNIDTVTIANTDGLHFIYFDADTLLLTSTTQFSDDIIARHCYVSVIYWNTSENNYVYFADERHGAVMDGATHIHLHSSLGAQYISGLGLINITANATVATDNTASFGITNGIIRDEDIKIEINNSQPQVLAPYANMPVLYRVGQLWHRSPERVIPNLVVNNHPFYNSQSNNIWSVNQVLNNKFFLIHIVATNDIEFPVMAILGDQYDTKNEARNNAILEFSTYTGLPFTEMVLLATVIYQYKTSFTNSSKTTVISYSQSELYIDWRKPNTFSPALPTSTTPTQSINLRQEEFVITQGILSAKQIVLSSQVTNIAGLELVIYGGIEQRPMHDFLVTGNIISWNSLSLELLLEEGSVMIVRYLS
jgi:hypothetical protein